MQKKSAKLQIPVSMVFNPETGATQFEYASMNEADFQNVIRKLFAPYFQKGSAKNE